MVGMCWVTIIIVIIIIITRTPMASLQLTQNQADLFVPLAQSRLLKYSPDYKQLARHRGRGRIITSGCTICTIPTTLHNFSQLCTIFHNFAQLCTTLHKFAIVHNPSDSGIGWGRPGVKSFLSCVFLALLNMH